MNKNIDEKDLKKVVGGNGADKPVPVSNCSYNFWNPCANCSCLQYNTDLSSTSSKSARINVSCLENRFPETTVLLDTFLSIAERSKGPKY